MKYKVLICAYSCVSESGVKNIGGEAELGWNIVKQLSRFFDVYVLTHRHNKESIEKMLEEEPLNNVSFFYIKLPVMFSFLERFHKGGIQIYSYLWQIKAYFAAKKLHKKNQFDVFHHITYANDWMASYIGALLPITYLRGPGGGAHRIPRDFIEEYSAKEKLGDKLRTVGQWIFRHDPFFILGQNRAKALLVCNKEAFNALPEKWGKKAYFFPVNGISEKDMTVLKFHKIIPSNDFLVFSAGKLIKIKGFDLAIKAFKVFSDKVGNAKLTIAGDGPELKNLKELVYELGLKEKVIFEGWLSKEKLLHKMSSCNVFIFPSLRDGGGNVVVEALAAGKPVVCFDLAGPGFHIDDNCGIKIKAENPKQAVRDTASALEKLYYQKELRDKLSLGARAKAEKNYNWDKLGDKLFLIYTEALSN